MLYRLCGLAYLFFFLLLLPVSASAQTGPSATLGVLNTDAFPQIGAYLVVHDADGNFVNGLQTDQVRVLENGKLLAISRIDELHSGSQVVVVLNPGPSFGIRNNQAISRYDYIKEALRNWANSRLGSTIDDWSLLITDGPSISHTSSPKSWIDTLDTEQIDARLAIPSLDTLFRAVSLAADPSIRPGMGRAVLFITPPPEGQIDQSLVNLSAQAQEQDVSIFVWMVASKGAFTTQAVENLMKLADETGGLFFAYSGEELLPDPEEYLEPLRRIYYLEYQSNITSSGSNQLSARVQIGVDQIETNIQNFEIDIQPPQPAFVSPPMYIQRKPITESSNQNDDKNPENNLTPQEQSIQVIFDFPDGRKRPIVQSSLYVDGVVVDENLEPPFDHFNWELDDYTIDGIHKLLIQGKDALGLTGTSIEIPVQITVEQPSPNPWSAIQNNIPILTALAVLLAGAVLLLVLLLGGRLSPYSLGRSTNRRRKSDPVTQPIRVDHEPPSHRLTNLVNRLHWPQRNIAPKAHAFLSRVGGTDDSSTSPPIPIISDEVTLGSDPSQATLVFDDLSIESLHARLTRQVDGTFRIADEGSIAGTWVNYTPVSKEGTKLEHGDLVSIARVGFRFTLRQPIQVRKPVITMDNSNSDEESPEETPK